MSDNTAIDTVSGLDFEEIEEAVMETTRGRWFLTEYARRQRANDTKILLGAIRRLEDQLLTMPSTVSVSADIDKLVQDAETEMHHLSGPAEVSEEAASADTDEPANARILASRLSSITKNLRDALDQPGDIIAGVIEPELNRLDTCASDQSELADKLSRTAQMVRRLRSSQSLDHDGTAQPAEKLIAAPRPEAVEPQEAKEEVEVEAEKAPAPAPKTPPAFVASDDDIFTDDPAPELQAASTPARLPSIGSDTLNFSDIEVPPLPSSVSSDDTEEEDADIVEEMEAGADELEASEPEIPAPASAAPQSAGDRLISVARKSSQGSQLKPAGDGGYSGRINMSKPAAANQAAVPSTATFSSAVGSNGKKRIIVIRRPADETGGIPLADSDFDGSGNGPSAA
jgi:hypothetical protein